MSLIEEVKIKAKEIFTDSYPMSIGELINLYEESEIDIHPEFQRFYRWTDEQKANLIESILLGIPIPPIFVAQREDGVWDVIDGLQRLSTIFEFVGILKDEKNERIPCKKLAASKYLPSLGNHIWKNEDIHKNEINSGELKIFDKVLQLDFKRAKLDFKIIKKHSDNDAKYELFQRLNTGGTQLTPQEVRNCILIMKDIDLYKWIRDMANYQSFVEACALSDKSIEEQYDMELATRFIVFYHFNALDLKIKSDLDNYVTEKIILLAKSKEILHELEFVFKKTFDIINNNIGERAFRKYNHSTEKYTGGFSISAFEAVTLGIAGNLKNNEIALESDSYLNEKAKDLWKSSAFTTYSGSGSNAKKRIPMMIECGIKVFSYGED